GLGKAGVDLGIASLAVHQRVENLAQHTRGGGEAGALGIQSVGILPGAVDDLAAGLCGGSRLGADAPSGGQRARECNEEGDEAYGQATQHAVTPFLRTRERPSDGAVTLDSPSSVSLPASTVWQTRTPVK